jgi:hypothetical protein
MPEHSWHDVLADCEAAAEHAETLLRERAGHDFDPRQLGWIDFSQLSLPPLPDELLERAHAVHQRNKRLQAELADAMSGLQGRPLLAAGGARPGPRALYLDRRA